MKVGLIFPSVILLILIFLIILCLGYPPYVRLSPLLIMSLAAVLLAIQILKELRAVIKQQGIPGDSGEKKITTRDTPAKGLRVVAWMIAIVVFVYLLGFLVGIPLFALLYLKLNGEKWLTTVIYVLLVIALVYGGFEVGLEVYLYKGLLFG